MYDCLQQLGYNHEVVIHSEEFVTNAGVHTNNMENIWCNVKAKFKTMNRLNETNLSFHLDKVLYRWNHKFDGDFVTLFSDIADFYL